MNTAANHCKTLRRVTKAELINALHASLSQFNAITRYETMTVVDNRPAIQEINRVMAKAGHSGFVK